MQPFIVGHIMGGANWHDALARGALSVPENAASQVRAMLPEVVTKRLDLERIRQEPASFVDAELRSRYSDLVFSVPLDGRDAFVYVLIEHQSSTDQWMAMRMLEYVVRLWRHYLSAHPGASRLPVVIPMVVHHNKRPWSGATALAELIDLKPGLTEALGDHVPRFRFLLDDLSAGDAEELRNRPLTSALRFSYALLAKVSANDADLLAQLWRWSGEVRAMLDQPGGKQMLQAQLEYIRNVTEVDDDDLHEWFAHIGPDAEEVFVTNAEKLLAKGEARGQAKGQAKALLLQLEIKFGRLSPMVVDTVHNASQEQLDTWTARILTADTLDDLFS